MKYIKRSANSYSATLKDKLSKKDADEFLAMYMARLRDLVDIIEAGGGRPPQVVLGSDFKFA